MAKKQKRAPEGLEERYERYRGILKDLTIMSDMYSNILADRVYELKETQKGVEFMCHEMEQIYSEGIENGIEKGIKKGIEKGIEQGKRETVLSLTEMGLSVEKIAKAVKLSVPEIQKWIDESVSGQ